MGGPEKPAILNFLRSALADSRGVGIPVALLGLLVIGALTAGLWSAVDSGARATYAREDALEARLLAEAGVAHAYSLIEGPLADQSFNRLLRGADNRPDTPDDGYLAGYLLSGGLGTLVGIPPMVGRSLPSGRYFVRVLDDPADGNSHPLVDVNDRVLLRSRGEGANGSTATVHAVVGDVALGPAGFVVDGDLKINGSAEVLGACQGIHANGSLILEGNLTLEGPVTSTGATTYDPDDPIQNPDGDAVIPMDGQPPRQVPTVDPMSHCDEADYLLRSDGYAEDLKTGSVSDGEDLGWSGGKKGGETLWKATDDEVEQGTYCVEGNVDISGNVGTDEDGGLPLSILASGSVSLSGTPQITADHPEGFLILAGGDVDLAGTADADEDIPNYAGFIYAGAQCGVSGTPVFDSNFVCRDREEPPGALDFSKDNRISGTPRLTYDKCSGAPPVYVRRILSWSRHFR